MLAKAAVASIDDIGAAAAKASPKAAGVVVDDTAVTPAYVQGLAAERELPIVRRIAFGSLRNKLAFIVPAALILSQYVPIAVEIILMFGGAYLAYEGAHKVIHRIRHHDGDAQPTGLASEDDLVRNAGRTDVVLSAEIMVIALKEVFDQGFAARAATLVVVVVVITAAVYGIVTGIVKLDDVGLRLLTSPRAGVQRIGQAMVHSVPGLWERWPSSVPQRCCGLAVTFLSPARTNSGGTPLTRRSWGWPKP
jgi:predicted DNA repair protein MutK